MSTVATPVSERDEVQLIRDLSSVWENPQLQQTRAALTGAAARPLLHYCARKILELRKRHGVSADEFPLTGRAEDVLLGELVSGKLDEINQFVTKIIRAGVQTSDGNYMHNINEAEVNTAVFNDPPVFSSERALSIARTLSDKIDQLLEDMIPLNHTLEEYSNLDVICRKLRNVEFRCYDTMKQRQLELQEKLRISAGVPAGAAATGGGGVFTAMPVHKTTTTPAMTPQPTTVSGMAEERVHSQHVNRSEVEKVRSHLLETMSPIQELRRSLSLFAPSESLTKRRKLMKNMRKRGRDFHEDLMNLLFALDDLKIFDETDRLFRRDTVEKVQDMLDELDSIASQMDQVALRAREAIAKEAEKPQLQAQVQPQAQPVPPQPQAAAELPEARPQAAEQPQAPATGQPPGGAGVLGVPTRFMVEEKEKSQASQMEKAKEGGGAVGQQQQQPTDVTKIDWHQLKLPVRFDSRVTPQAYLLLASLANLDLQTLKLTVAAQEDSLRVEGFKAPTESEKKQIEQTQDVFKALANAQGRFGTFKEEFQLPKDVQTSEIYAEYNRGILRVVIPRNIAARPVESFFGVPGEFFEGEFWW